jgi:hypothetical protein
MKLRLLSIQSLVDVADGCDDSHITVNIMEIYEKEQSI